MNEIPERVASLEAKIESHGRSIDELLRQQSAQWKRVDEMQSTVDNVKLEAAKEGARMETKLAEMDKNALRESFGMKTQIAEIGWRVGIIIGAALLILNFFIGKIDLFGFLGRGDNQTKSSKR